MKIKREYDLSDILFGIVFGTLGVFALLLVAGFTVYMGQQLIWQLRRADCGSYTIKQEKDGNIPLQCKQEGTKQ